MNGQKRFRRNTGLLFSLGVIASLALAGCNYPNQPPATDTVTATNPPAPTATVTPIPTKPPSATPAPSSTPDFSPTPAASSTPEATATPASEQVGIVQLFGKEIGVIQKKGGKFLYIPDPNIAIPLVEGKVLIQISDPQKVWGFDMENSNSPLYIFKEDPRPGWEGYGTLVVYEGCEEVIMRFTILNAQTGEKIKSWFRMKIYGAMARVSETPEVEGPPQ